jgi:hypothetical protein
MEVYAAVESVRLLIKPHRGLLAMGVGAGSRIVVGRARSFLKIPRWADALAPSLQYPWDRRPAHPKGAMMSINLLHLTAAALRRSGVRRITSRRGR